MLTIGRLIHYFRPIHIRLQRFSPTIFYFFVTPIGNQVFKIYMYMSQPKKYHKPTDND